MRVLAHRGNRLHAPENTRTALLSAYTSGAEALELDVQLSRDGELVVSHDASLERLAGEGKAIIESDLGELRKLDVSRTFAPRGASDYRYKQPGRRGVRVETLGPLLDALPRDVPKLIELKHDSSLGTGRREEFVEETMAAITDRHMLSEVVLYSKDPDNLHLVRQLEPRALVCAFDWELEPKEQVELVRTLRADGLVIEIGHLLEGGHLTETAHELARLYADQGLAVGAVVYLYREPAVFTREEFETLRSHPFVWSLATDSTIDVLEFTRSPGDFVAETFAGTETDTDLFALGYAKANRYGHVFQDDGVHVNIAEWDGDGEPASDDPVERRLQELEERLWYAERSWPFYSGGGVGLVPGISGDFVAEVDYEVTRVGEASTLEMAAVNVDPGAHQPPWNPDGTPRYPRTMRDKDSFFDPHGAPPFAGVEHDEADGYRINWNLGTEYDSNQYGRPCGDGTALAGRLRLERRGPWFSAYYRNDDAPDWVCVGAERNDSLNSRVFLRCAGKRWRQEREDDPSSYHPIVPVDFTFRNLLIKRT